MELTIVLTGLKDAQKKPVTMTVKSLKHGSEELMSELTPEDVEKIIEEFKKEGIDAKVIYCPWFSMIGEKAL